MFGMRQGIIIVSILVINCVLLWTNIIQKLITWIHIYADDMQPSQTHSPISPAYILYHVVRFWGPAMEDTITCSS